MRVLIYGVNTRNKGAQLLLAATAERLRQWGHEPAVSARDVTKQSRREFKAKGLFSVEKLGPLRSAGLNVIPRALDVASPLIGDGRFDYVVDASGFSLTDSWGMAPVTSRLTRLERWSRKNIRYSMLPQAFGPFTDSNIASGVRRIAGYADQVWARDEVSRDHVARLRPHTSLGVAPDITIGYQAGASRTDASGAVVIVPNWNLAERGEGGAGRYLHSLTEIARQLQESGREVVGMSHEGARDLALIQEVAERVPGLRVLDPASGVECKQIISGADFVIAGRYHALVSALSSAVPVVGHSWSHKYAALMRDFEVRDGLADPMNPGDTVERVLSLDMNSERERLREQRGAVLGRVDEVWSKLRSSLTEARVNG